MYVERVCLGPGICFLPRLTAMLSFELKRRPYIYVICSLPHFCFYLYICLGFVRYSVPDCFVSTPVDSNAAVERSQEYLRECLVGKTRYSEY